MSKRLSQVLAIEKAAKQKANDVGAAAHKTLQKAETFFGMRREFVPHDDADESLKKPPETKPVQASASELLKNFLDAQAHLCNVTLTKDVGNTQAFANLDLGGPAPISLPVTYLIWLEKQANDLRTLFLSIPVLGADRSWSPAQQDPDLWESDTNITQAFKKVKKIYTLAPATDKHPAQTQLLDEDVFAGVWKTTYQARAMEPKKRQALITKAETLIRKIKEAREEANARSVEEMDFGSALLGFLEV